MQIKLFGIPNCGSVKKARTFLDEYDLTYEFHDYKKLGIDEEHLNKWCEQFGWEKVLNRKGLTYRNLDETIKQQIIDQESAIKLMVNQTSTIKRPVLESEMTNLIGFHEEEYSNILT